MPDPNRKIISASQVAALFNVSPYQTRWMLYQSFKNPDWPDQTENERMEAGRFMEPGILAWSAHRMRLEVTPVEQVFVAREDGLIGTTLDARVYDPQRGQGVVEAKLVDWLVWKDEWTEDAAPKHIEIQVQSELMATGHEWAIIACCVGGNDLRLYERVPMPEIQEQIRVEIEVFYQQLRGEIDPPPATGRSIEIPGLLHLYPEAEPTVEAEAMDITAAEAWVEYERAKQEAGAATKHRDNMKARLLGLAGNAGKLKVPGSTIYIKKTRIPARTQHVQESIRTTFKGREELVPQDLPPDQLDKLMQLYGGANGGY